MGRAPEAQAQYMGVFNLINSHQFLMCATKLPSARNYLCCGLCQATSILPQTWGFYVISPGKMWPPPPLFYLIPSPASPRFLKTLGLQTRLLDVS